MLITSHSPIPPVNGGFQRSNLLGRALKRIGQLHTLYFRPASEITLTDENRDRLREEFGLVGVIPALNRDSMIARLAACARPDPRRAFGEWPEVSEVVRRIVSTQPYDVIVCRYLVTAARSGVLYRSRIPVIVDIDDLFGVSHRLLFGEADVVAWRRLYRWYQWRDLQRREIRRSAG